MNMNPILRLWRAFDRAATRARRRRRAATALGAPVLLFAGLALLGLIGAAALPALMPGARSETRADP